MKMCEMNYFSLFCKLYLVLFLTFIIRTPILCCTTWDLGIFWHCSRDFWSCICESPDGITGVTNKSRWENLLWKCVDCNRILWHWKIYQEASADMPGQK